MLGKLLSSSVLIFALRMMHLCASQEIRGFKFVKDSPATSCTSLLMPRNSSFTFCSAIKLHESIPDATFARIRSPVIIEIAVTYFGVVVALGQEELLFEVPLPPLQWHHVCVTYDSTINELQCYFNGIKEKLSSANSKRQTKKSEQLHREEATLQLLGNDHQLINFNVSSGLTDKICLNAELSPFTNLRDQILLCLGSKAFVGEIASPNLWPVILNDGSVKELGKCKNSVNSSLLSGGEKWDGSNVYPLNFTEICDLPQQSIINVEINDSYWTTEKLCLGLGGNILNGDSVADVANEVVLEEHRKACKGVGIHSWILTKSETTEVNSMVPRCLALDSTMNLTLVTCVEKLQCSYCNVNINRFTLYGHDGKLFDYVYFLNIKNIHTFWWHGISGSHIRKRNNLWILASELHSTEWVLHNSSSPVGRLSWVISNELGKNLSKMLLTFTSCKTWQFSCNSGECIDISQRCDGLYHCSDNTDEMQCFTLERLKGYDRLYVPPPRPNETVPLYLDYHVEVNSLENIQTDQGIAKMDIVMTMTWYDSRVTFNNLRPGIKNHFPCDMIWIPVVRAVSGFGEGAVLETTTYSSQCYVNGSSEGKRLLTDPWMGHSSSGERTPIINYVGVLAEVECRFNLPKYPFDVQYCNITFMVMNAPGNRVFRKFTPGQDIPYLDPRRNLLEYELVAVTTDVSYFMQDDDNNTYFVIIYHLHRMYGYHVLGAFTPTLMTAIIAYSTFFFPIDHFVTRVGVAIIAQFDLAAFYSAITSASVKTPYMKLSDVWFAAIIAIIFCVIISQVLVNVVFHWHRLKRVASRLFYVREFAPIGEESYLDKEDDQRMKTKWAYLANSLCAIIILIGIIGFIVVFAILSYRIMRRGIRTTGLAMLESLTNDPTLIMITFVDVTGNLQLSSIQRKLDKWFR